MGKRLRLFARLFAHSPPGRWPALGWYLLATAIRKATGLVLLRDTVLCFDGIRILAFEQAVDGGGADGDGGEHEGAVGDRLVARDARFAGQRLGGGGFEGGGHGSAV